jgi:hypothetical protein
MSCEEMSAVLTDRQVVVEETSSSVLIREVNARTNDKTVHTTV